MQQLIQKLAATHSLTEAEYARLIRERTPESAKQLRILADRARREVYGTQIFIRGLIEVSSICKNDCLYCGLRRSNESCQRYRLRPREILDCCEEGYDLGFRTFVLQGGEDGFYNDSLLEKLIRDIKFKYPDCAVTLSLGERRWESYKRLFEAGADRYLLRHETADPEHYASIHPKEMSYENRMRCLRDLKEIGYQVGCGFMVGSPGQTPEHLSRDLKFIEEFQPEMVGIGPFLPQSQTPFADQPPGTAELTVYLLSIIRLILPNVLLPATTALATLSTEGREEGILAGANVIMPNLSPAGVRQKYALYDNKRSDGDESAQAVAALSQRMAEIGFEIVTDRGDHKK